MKALSIAICAGAARFPGADDLQALWQLVVERRSAAREIPTGRWPVEPSAVHAGRLGVADRAASLRGCFLEKVALDPALRVAGVDLDRLDEVHRLALQVGAEAFRAARMEGVDRGRIGVVLANIALPTESASASTRALLGDAFATRATGVASSFQPAGVQLEPLERHGLALPASLLCSALGLGGGATTLDAACASSLYAIQLACMELESGRADAMLAGGVCRPQSIYTQIGFSQLQALSPTGRCAPFDRDADGLVVGEGAGIFVLKRLADAEAQGDEILGVIRGIGLSNDVAGSLLSPASEGQLRAMRAAWEAAGWARGEVDLVECHGTGTQRGDAVELASLRELLGDTSAVIGSVKANVGHTLTAAGAAALGKVLLGFRHRLLPPATNNENAVDTGSLRLLRSAAPWERPAGRPRRAAVSAFGFGGINAHLLVEQYEGAVDAPASQAAAAQRPGGGASAPADAPASQTAAAQRPGDGASAPADAPASQAAAAQRPGGGACAPETHPPQGGSSGATAATAGQEWAAADARPAQTAPIGAAPAVAIVGIGAHVGRLAGRRAVREALLRGDAVLDERPAARWHGLEGDAPRGAWLDALEIPIGRYKLPPNEISSLLPQQLLALETALEAAEDVKSLGESPRHRTGCVIGLGLDPGTTDFHLRWTLPQSARAWAEASGEPVDEEAIAAWVEALQPHLGRPLDAPAVLGALGGVLAGRVGRELGLGGPSFALAGAEGAGLRALDAAVRLLQRGEVDAMIVGAVDLAGDVRAMRATEALRGYTQRGSTRAFDESGDGPTVGEGAVSLVVKRLEDAQRDGDRIYAVIRGMGSASGGAGAYDRALAAAWAEAGIDRARASLVAAHGSADPAEDRLEAEALHRFFGSGEAVPGAAASELRAGGADAAAAGAEKPGTFAAARELGAGDRDAAAAAPASPAEKRCAITSARGVLGDTGAVSGLASVLHAAFGLFHEVLPPLPGIHRPRAGVDWDAGPFHLPRAPQPWLRDRSEGERVACVSSIGLDGTCQHLVLEGARLPADAWRAERARPLGERAAAIFVVQGRDEAELGTRIAALRERIGGAGAQQDAATLEAHAAAWWRANGVRAGLLTRAFVAGDPDELIRALARPAPAAGRHLDGSVAFVYPGSGNHYPGMGVGLGLAFPEAIRALDATTGQLRTQTMPAWYAPWRSDWSEGAEADAARKLGRESARMMLGQVAHGIAGTGVLRSLGVHPRAAIGYSLGESAALFSMGAWTDRDGMFARTLATPLFTEELAGRYDAARRAYGEAAWHVAVVNRAAPEVRAALAGTAALLIVNAPGECVIGGRREDVEATVAALGCEAFPLEGVPTVHCDLARDAAGAYHALHVQRTQAPAGVRIYSCAWAAPYEPSAERCADSILHNALHGFDFPQVIERAWKQGVRIFVEAGPQNSCTRMIGRILAGREHLAVSICQRGVDPARSVLQGLARLAEAGVAIELASLYGSEGGISLEVPARRQTVRVLVGREPAPLPPPPWRKDARAKRAAGREPARNPAARLDTALPAPTLQRGAAPDEALSIPALQRGALRTPPNTAPPASALHHAAMLTPSNTALPASALQRGALRTPSIAAGAAPARAPGIMPAALASPTGTRTMPHDTAATPSGSASAAALQIRDRLVAAQTILAQAAHTAAAHAQFLAGSASSFALQRQALAQRDALLHRLLGDGSALPNEAALPATVLQGGVLPPAPQQPAAVTPAHPLPPAHPSAPQQPAPSTPPAPLHLVAETTVPASIAFDRDMCMEFAIGSIGRMLGPDFAAIDSHPSRVRLPDEPLMLVDRIVSLEGAPNQLGAGRVVTEHDVLPGAWYLDGGRSPVCISVESGQADLFLAAWLGIDHQTKGERLYRLLDAQVIFHRDLPRLGETVRYDIHVDRFIRQGDTYLMFFHFDGTVDGAPLITMRDGCAGFFSPQQLASGRGVVGDLPSERPTPREGSTPFRPLLPQSKETYGDEQVAALRRGDLEACFGPAFAGITLPQGLRLPGGRMELVDRIVELDPEGGRYGLGRIVGEADIQPDDWFLTCHFSDDPVMPGTLMYECCLHTLRVYLLRLGWVFPEGDGPADLHVAPVVGATSRLRCRGQVTPTTRKVRYRIDIKEIGYGPEPYVLADASMFVDDLHAIEMEGMSLRYVGADGSSFERLWEERQAFDRQHILTFAGGKPSAAFGPRYAAFDEGKRMARLPRPPFSFIDEIRATAGRRWQLAPGAAAEAHFEVTPDAFFFGAGRSGEMPFAVLLEVALQPCGWLAAYLGAALRSDQELFFRNLEGDAVQHRPVLPDEGRLTTTCTLDSVSEAGGMILLAYRFSTASARGLIFEGKTRFGFFPERSLAQQAGIGVDGASLERPATALAPIERVAPLTPDDAGRTGDPAQQRERWPVPTSGLPAGAWQMLDAVALQNEGGPAGLGLAAGTLDVDPAAWFFHAHFFEDPVMPGSLGVEAFHQLVQRWLHGRFPERAGRVVTARCAPHLWTYRGQVRPHNAKVEVLAHIKALDGAEVRADGFLLCDGQVIYAMRDTVFQLGAIEEIIPAAAGPIPSHGGD